MSERYRSIRLCPKCITTAPICCARTGNGRQRSRATIVRWRSNRRNIPLAKLAVLNQPGVELYSLQKGEAAEAELAQLPATGRDLAPIRDFTAELHDFADTAALIAQLDLVISVDTATAHLAGAMGKPVWLLNRFDGCWRWLIGRRDSPWYPTLRLHRQPRRG